jgi:preprotein translocase subunit SecG
VPNKNSKGFEAFKVYSGEKSFSSKLEIVLKITIALFMFIFLILALRIVYKIVNDEV